MTALRKIVVLVFLTVFVAAFILAALGGTKKIEMADGALVGFFAVLVSQCLTAIVVAFRAPDFWKDDPFSVTNLQRRHAEEVAALKQAHVQELESVKDSYAATALTEKKEKLKLARELAIIRNPPKTVPGTEISAEEFKKRYPDE